jgi:hypothetical protein
MSNAADNAAATHKSVVKVSRPYEYARDRGPKPMEMPAATATKPLANVPAINSPSEIACEGRALVPRSAIPATQCNTAQPARYPMPHIHTSQPANGTGGGCTSKVWPGNRAAQQTKAAANRTAAAR